MCKNHMIISTAVEKAFVKIQYNFMMKVLENIDLKGHTPALKKKSYAQKTHSHIILNGEELEAIHLKSGMNETGLFTVSTPFQYCPLSTSWSNKTRKGN